MSIDLSPKLKICLLEGSDRGLCLLHWCPGCKQVHLINVEKPNHLGAIWTWDRNPKFPTFTPSVNIVGVCHYRLTAGILQYCGDSTHHLSGQTVELPDFPADSW